MAKIIRDITIENNTLNCSLSATPVPIQIPISLNKLVLAVATARVAKAMLILKTDISFDGTNMIIDLSQSDLESLKSTCSILSSDTLTIMINLNDVSDFYIADIMTLNLKFQ